MSGPSHDLLVGPADASGASTSGVDLELCADIARSAAQTARAWAGNATWTGLGGFDSTGGFWLEPAEDGRLRFLRDTTCQGWLRDPETTRSEPLAAKFPAAIPPLGAEAPAPFSTLQFHIAALPGFAGCALRHHKTGLWKPVIAPPDAPRLGVATRAFTPLSRILASQGLPVARLLLLTDLHAAIAWRNPGKIFGYLHLLDHTSLAAATALADHLILCTAQANQD